MNFADKAEFNTMYHEEKIDKTLYRVTSVYTGEIELAKAIEDLIIQKLLRDDHDEE